MYKQTTRLRAWVPRPTYGGRYLVSNEEGYFGVQVAKVLFLSEVFSALETDLVFQLLDFNLG